MKDLHTKWKGRKLNPIHLKDSFDPSFFRYGYKILNGNIVKFNTLKSKFKKLLFKKLTKFSNRKLSYSKFSLENYHLFMKENDLDHHDFIKSFSRNISEELAENSYVKDLISIASKSLSIDFELFEEKMEFRVVRPGKDDNNPLHRDHWFPYFNNLLNIYLPLSGSWNDSSLSIVPTSHNWDDQEIKPSFHYSENKKTIKNGIAYSVPTIKKSKNDLKIHRPDVSLGNFMIFSPRLVHGGASNKSLETRFSLELRLKEIV
ncbi:MAG: phytanoyl-CoA dioxygenase family protein [Gammaproteobacteria bacterium]|tara:strand:- start:175 stop:954 length:780 start_codon:yes stop_codon:yes gene_type:complete